MSVILTACKKSRQHAIEKALKKKAERKREKREAKLAGMMEQMVVPEDTSSVKMWTFLLNGQANSIIYHLDTLDISNNGVDIEAKHEFTKGGSRVTFHLGEHMAEINTEASSGAGRDGLLHTLTVDGNYVPGCSD